MPPLMSNMAGSTSDRRVSSVSYDQGRMRGSPLQACQYPTRHHFHWSLLPFINLFSPVFTDLHFIFETHLTRPSVGCDYNKPVWQELEKENKEFFEAYKQHKLGERKVDETREVELGLKASSWGSKD